MSQSDGMEIRILDDRLRQWGLPSYQSEMAAAIDLYACLQETVELRGGEHLLIPAGFAVNMANPNIAALVLPRSGLGHKQGLVCGNLVGLIDPDYTGEILISAWNRNAPGRRGVVIKPGDRIAQMVFVPVQRPSFRLVDAFSTQTARGAAGFGSTGSGIPSAMFSR